MKSLGKLLLVILILAGAAESAAAGVLYARRPGTESPVYNLRISHIRTTVTIAGQLAVTHVDEEFFNDNHSTLEGFYAFQLPEGAHVDGLWLWVNGERRIFVVKKKEEAERLYDSVVVGQRRDPAILESLGKNRFQLKVFPIGPFSSRRIEMRYFHTLPLTEDGTVHYRYPLNLQGYQSTPVESTTLRINVESKLPVEDITTNFDDNPLLCRKTIFGDHEFRIDFGDENTFYSQDFELAYKPADVYSVFPALSWHDPEDPAEESYFICWHPEKPEAASTQARDLVFVLDASGSMGTEQIGTVRDAVISILRKLRSIDRFRIVLFSNTAIAWPALAELRAATTENIEEGVDFIQRTYAAGGSTNYGMAFRAGLAAEFRPEAVRRMLFLTDGMPNTGQTSKEGLLSIIEDNDELGVGIYPVIVYSDRIDLLYDIADARGGKVTMVENGDGLETVISRIMLELDIAAISSPVVTYEGGQTWLVYPESFPPYAGVDRLVTTGRLVGTAPEPVRLTYRNAANETVERLRSVDFTAMRTDMEQVASYWAAAHIGSLLEQYERTPNDELKESIIALSIKHRILTPFTAFLVLENNPIDPPTSAEAVAEVIPEEVSLGRNYPNPFSLSSAAVTVIPYTLGSARPVRIVVTDILGRVIRVLEDGMRSAGAHSVSWDGRDMYGHAVTPGVYFLRLQSGSVTKTLRMSVMR